MKELRGFELTGTNIPNIYPWQHLPHTPFRKGGSHAKHDRGILKMYNSIDARSDVFEIRIFNGTCEPFTGSVYKQFSWWLQSGGNT